MTNVVSGLFSLDAPMVMVLACVIGAVQVAVHILKRAFDLWLDTVDRHVPARIEPTWPGKITPHKEAGPAISGTLPEGTSSEISGRHAKIDPDAATSLMELVTEPAQEVGVL